MFGKLFGQETEFQKSMLCFAANLEKAGGRFAAFLRVFDPTKLEAWIKEIKDLEHACDETTHQTMKWLQATFIVNFDREDIHQVVGNLDDIVDFIDAAATRISLYSLTEVLPEIVNMADVLNSACQETAKAVRSISGQKLSRKVLEICRQIKDYEEEGDKIYHQALATLFKGDKAPLDVIKFKEIIEDIERALDMCNQSAMNIESIILKYS